MVELLGRRAAVVKIDGVDVNCKIVTIAATDSPGGSAAFHLTHERNVRKRKELDTFLCSPGSAIELRRVLERISCCYLWSKVVWEKINLTSLR